LENCTKNLKRFYSLEGIKLKITLNKSIMNKDNKQKFEFQGRTPRQVENSYKIMEWTFLSAIAFGVIYSIGKALAIW
jgi:hypothetical protein